MARLLSSVEWNGKVYKIVVTEWGEYQVRTLKNTLIKCCLFSEQEALDYLELMSKRTNFLEG